MVTPLAVPRGPRPWREPRTRQDWLVLGAWLQLGAVVYGLAVIAFVVWWVRPGAGLRRPRARITARIHQG